MSRLNIWSELQRTCTSPLWRFEWFQLRVLSISSREWSVICPEHSIRRWNWLWPVKIPNSIVPLWIRSVIRCSICFVILPIMVLRIRNFVFREVSRRLVIFSWMLIRKAIMLSFRLVMTVMVSIQRRSRRRQSREASSRQNRRMRWHRKKSSISCLCQASLWQRRLRISPEEVLVLMLLSPILNNWVET